MHTQTIKQLAEALAAKSVSSRELTEYYLGRIRQLDSGFNSFISITEEQALAQADAADALLRDGKAGALTGIPFAHKDIFCTQGIRTSCGSKMLDNFIAPYNATVVEKMADAGMVMLGKTNMDEFAMGSSNETSWYGAVNNPWDTNRIPGGSSGGSATAVAARLVPAATGTDTGGSIRQPCSLCGITGIKPTYGRVSRFGMIAFASSLDQGGPMTITAEDAAMVLNAMAGFDERDSTSMDMAVPDFTANLNQPLDGKVIGVPKEFFGEGLDSAVGAVVEEALREYEKLGATLKEISLPNSGLSVPAYYVIAPAECSSNLSRFDGVRFGYRCDNPKDLQDLYERTRQEGFGAEVKRRIMIGTYVLSAGYYDAYYIKAQQLRRLISEDFKQAFTEVDVIMGPVSPHVATPKGAITDPVAMYLSDIYTIAVNLAGLPAMSIPAGFANNMPVGLQLIGPAFEESRLLSMAHLYQHATDWHVRTPI
jgi:aspartyl-tRNA(Asn)/glutamyl-tRNA(Gln) amidotransferase subunit A